MHLRQKTDSKREEGVVAVAPLKFRVYTETPTSDLENEKNMLVEAGTQFAVSTNLTDLAVHSVKSAFFIITVGAKRIIGTSCPFKFSDFG